MRVATLPAADAVPFDDAARAGVAAAREFAPLHTDAVLAVRDRLAGAFREARHVAVFDAAFHRTIPDRAAAYGLPYEAFVAGWRKVGFHGLSHGYAAARAAFLLDRRPLGKLVSVHLGSGASIAAIEMGRSIDTTMGFTPLDGLLMSTRSGSIDPGMLLAYMRSHGLSIDVPKAAPAPFHRQARGFADMREILHRVARRPAPPSPTTSSSTGSLRGIGSMMAALGGTTRWPFSAGSVNMSP